jgi:hypothetical protein
MVKITLMIAGPKSRPSRRPSDRSAEVSETGHEATVSRYFEDYVTSGRPAPIIYIFRNPVPSLRAFLALRRLPCVHACSLSAGIEGAAIQAALAQRSILARVTGLVMSVLTLPREPEQYSLGASKQTLRRMARRAQRLGVSWVEVTDPHERRELLKLADDYERRHPKEAYRRPDPPNGDLLEYGLWLAAYSAAGHPVLLSVTPVDGEFALLRYFRTIGAGPEQTNARYLMTDVLARHLIIREVRYLIDTEFPARLTNGLRHFQRMLGFRLVRIRVTEPFHPDLRVMWPMR